MLSKYFKSNVIVALLIYIIMFFLGSSVVLILILNIVATSQGIDPKILLETINSSSDLEEYIKASALVQALSNFVTYFVLFVLMIVFLRDKLKSDFIKIKSKKLKFVIQVVGLSILFYLAVFLIQFVTSRYVDQSTNQNSIEFLFDNGQAFLMIIVTVLFAPIVEELFYRKAIFSVFEYKKAYIPILISALAFALPHMISTQASVLDWILIAIPYLFSGLAFAIIYEKTDRNIYVTIGIHAFNNIMACIFMFF
ncbi:MAG: lysostaphin resistance A-like protein [Anaeroplasmataceae bacterium]